MCKFDDYCIDATGSCFDFQPEDTTCFKENKEGENMYCLNHYVINWEKVKTFEDIKRLVDIRK